MYRDDDVAAHERVAALTQEQEALRKENLGLKENIAHLEAEALALKDQNLLLQVNAKTTRGKQHTPAALTERDVVALKERKRKAMSTAFGGGGLAMLFLGTIAAGAVSPLLAGATFVVGLVVALYGAYLGDPRQFRRLRW